MLTKQRVETLELMQLEALDRRLHPFHPRKDNVQIDYRKKRSGIKGEREVAYSLGFLNENQYIILHNLRLSDQNGFFQIDKLVLTTNYLLVLEVKNWYGTIVFHESGQVTRVGDNEVEEGFPNPILQAKLQRHRLIKWLNQHTTLNIPLDFFVVISFPSTIIKSKPSNYPIPKEVIHNNHLFFKIEELANVYTKPAIKKKQLMNLSTKLIEANTPSTESVLRNYSIPKSELIKGIICPNCSAVPMIWGKGRSQCGVCGHFAKQEYLVALSDYHLLLGDIISNREAREFLQINSTYVMRRLLQNAKYKTIGNYKSRVYVLE